MSNAETLLARAREKFGELTLAEKLLINTAAEGVVYDYSRSPGASADIDNSANWDRDQTIRADILGWLCTDPEAVIYVTHRGIEARWIRFEGCVNLSFANIEFPISFVNCILPSGFLLTEASLTSLHLFGCRISYLNAQGIKVTHDVYMGRGFVCTEGVSFIDAVIGGNLRCPKGTFIRTGRPALDATRIMVGGDVYFGDGFNATGEVQMTDGRIGAVLNCQGGHFSNKGACAFSAERISVGGAVYMNKGCRAEGEVRLSNANIGRTFDCEGGQFVNENAHAISADGMTVDGTVNLRNGFLAKGEVCLWGAHIGGDLDCSDANFTGDKDFAIHAERILVKGDILFTGNVAAKGEVNLIYAKIEGCLNFDSGTFNNDDRDAIVCDGAKVVGEINFSDEFKAYGCVRLPGASVGGSFVLDHGQFLNPTGDAVNAANINVNEHVFARQGCVIRGRFILDSANIKGSFVCTGVAPDSTTVLDLRNATIGSLWDEKSSWPEKGKLHLHGFQYKLLEDRAPKESALRLEWLHLQPDDQYYAQPYEQLAEVLLRGGHKDEATKILIAKYEDPVRLRHKNTLQKFWNWFFGATVDYGYHPAKALYWFFGFFLFGAIVYGLADGAGLICSISAQVPKFNPFAYSLDSLLPIIDLQNEMYWVPNVWYISVYSWFHILFGWLLTSLFITGLTRSVRN